MCEYRQAGSSTACTPQRRHAASCLAFQPDTARTTDSSTAVFAASTYTPRAAVYENTSCLLSNGSINRFCIPAAFSSEEKDCHIVAAVNVLTIRYRTDGEILTRIPLPESPRYRTKQIKSVRASRSQETPASFLKKA